MNLSIFRLKFFIKSLLFSIIYSVEKLSISAFLFVLKDSKTNLSKLDLLLIFFIATNLFVSNPSITGFFIKTSPSAFIVLKNSSTLKAFPLICNLELISVSTLL